MQQQPTSTSRHPGDGSTTWLPSKCAIRRPGGQSMPSSWGSAARSSAWRCSRDRARSRPPILESGAGSTHAENDGLPASPTVNPTHCRSMISAAITEHGWQVAGPNSYPLVMKSIPPGELIPSSKEEDGAARGGTADPSRFRCPAFPRRRTSPCRAAEATFDLPNVHANQKIPYRYPVKLPELAALRQQVGGEQRGVRGYDPGLVSG